MARRKFSADQKTAIVLSGLRGEVSVAELCREHGISQALYYRWRDQFLKGGQQAFNGGAVKTEVKALKSRISELERQLGKKAYELEILGKALGR
ncbi:MAG: transposase [Proteobacteria bacterium]|nr:transposase [Pseudomonadota bacterium]MBU1742449.1 transposase [Pseudomonadota bacterium]